MKKVNYPMDIDETMEQIIRERMQDPVLQPEEVTRARAQAYETVRSMAAAQKAGSASRLEKDTAAGRGNYRKGKVWKTFAGAAAAAAVFSGVCIGNPALAERIPLVGRVFEELGSSLGFSGNYEKYAKPLQETASGEENPLDTVEGNQERAIPAEAAKTTDGVYEETVDGVSVLLSEIYCNEKALYLSMIIQSEDPLPDVLQTENGAPWISLDGAEMKFSYNPQKQWVDMNNLDGRMIDEHTYAGVLRVDLDPTLRWPVTDENSAEEEMPETDDLLAYESVSLPDAFTVDLSIRKIVGLLPDPTTPQIPEELKQAYEQALIKNGIDPAPEAYGSYTEEQKEIEHRFYTEMMNQYSERYPETDEWPNAYENWWFDGDWNFTVDVQVDDSETIQRAVGADGTCPFGEISVTKTPFEITLDYDSEKALDYYVTVLDADGEPLGSGTFGGYSDVHPIADHDVSKITVYVCDYIEYMDELKGYYFSEDYEEKAKDKTYQQLLAERCVYSKEIVF